MALTKVVYTDGVTVIYASNLNAIQDAIIALEQSGGTSDYDQLSNRPQINSVTLSGNKSLSDLGIEPEALVVTVTESGGVYSADKTYDQIMDAVNADKRVVAVYDGKVHHFFGDLGYNAVFSAIYDYTTRLISIPYSESIQVFAKTLGSYSKPSGGIPSSDMASAVQTSLGKADTAYQKPSGGIPAADIASGVIPSVPSASTSNPAALGTASAGSSVYWSRGDHVHPKPSLSDLGAAPAVTEVTNTSTGDVTLALDPGKIYHFTGAVSSLTLTLTAAGTGIIPQYHFDFDSGSTAATVSITGVTWQGGSFTPSASKHYEVDILNGYGVVCEW